MAAVRPYTQKDKENVRIVCLETGPSNAYEPKERALLLACFCDYYIENEPENCFVVADDSDNAVGYIFCARDCRSYYRVFRQKYIPAAREASLAKGIMAWFTTFPVRFYSKKYPAHLHIDILPDYQRRGFGSLLMDANIGNLKARHVPGVMLVCGSRNQKGINFYKKYGFKKVADMFGFTVMGMDLR